MKTFFLKKEFNRFDLLFVCLSCGFVTKGLYIEGFITLIIGSIIGVVLSKKYGESHETKPARRAK